MNLVDERPWWRREMDEHQQREGRCPICLTRRRCWAYANARAAAVQMGHLP